ncbi:MAG: T9SS type A sorting domain-containing protein, partial [Flavobacteriales bacterium]|nr:T9SS type A sorting domain-containing protein [Flavobacteriales bacterium]
AGTVPLRTIARPSYACLLNWFTLPLTDGVYNVSVEVLVGGQWSGYCGPVCPLTISSPPAAFAGRDLDVVSNSAMQVWPNPVRDGQVNLLIEGLTDETQRVSVEVFDLFGKRVMATQQDNSGEVFNTVLELDGFATGVYMINVTVNDQVYMQRISVL